MLIHPFIIGTPGHQLFLEISGMNPGLNNICGRSINGNAFSQKMLTIGNPYLSSAGLRYPMNKPLGACCINSSSVHGLPNFWTLLIISGSE
jgi:hypothetical protein